jgi:hypothetical protein
MIENVMHNIGGVGFFGIASVCLFFAFFAGMLLWTSRLKKAYLKSMEGLPLDGESLSHSQTVASARNVYEQPG